MKALMRLIGILLAAASAAVLCASGFLFWRVISSPKEEASAVLQTDAVFQPVEQAQPEPEPEPVPVEEPAAPEADYLAGMTLEEKLWQLFITTPEAITGVPTATRAGETTQSALAQYPVGGLCYFADNLETESQVREMLANTQSYAGTPLFLCIDEEGGVVSRAGANPELPVTHFPSAQELGALGDPDAVYDVGRTLAEELMDLGFNLNFAPVADVITEPENREIGTRAYSTDPQVAGSMVQAMVQGLQEQGMAACLKHFPGHGSTKTDSHEDRSLSHRTVEELRQTEWVPFQMGVDAGAAFVMLSHQTNENLSQLPASLSAEVVGYLRQELGFGGIIITDSQQMGAITGYFAPGEAAVLAVEAGADMILMPADLQAAFAGLQAAVAEGRLTEERIDESVLRILRVKLDFGILS